jgi:inner membrane protein
MMYPIQDKPSGFKVWLKESVTAKLVFIVILTLLLLIPSVMIGNLIDERAERRAEVIKDISYNFAGTQVIKGPVLVIPYRLSAMHTDAQGKPDTQASIQKLYILPNELAIKATLKTEVMHRGIFNVVVYKTQVHIAGNFSKSILSLAGINPGQLLPGKAFVTFGISDLKGLKNSPEFKLGEQTLAATPASDNNAFTDGLQVSAANAGELAQNDLPFSYTLDLNGTDGLSFLQMGKTTDVEVDGNWGTPSFDGRILPDTRKIGDSNFYAHWHMLYYNTPYPQWWTDPDNLVNNMAKQGDVTFGVKLRMPVDDYQETTRTNKYAILIILLTFVSLVLTELIRKQKIHSFNYVLIGAAMIIFYTLLLSFSEQIGFNWAYLVASAATIGLITLFIASLLKNRGAALSFAGILSVFYAFIFIIIQLEDFALMAGSVALFIIVALLMYFSRKINWDNNGNDEKLIATNDFV